MSDRESPMARRWRLPATKRLGFAGCVLLAASMHCALLASPSVTPAPPKAGSIAPSVWVRHIAAASPRPVDEESAATETPTPMTPRAVAQTAPAVAEDPKVKAPPAAPPPADDAGESTRAASASATPPRDLDAEYMPRAALTVGPKAITPVVVDFPRFDGEADFYTGEFDLYIDADGTVARVAVATPQLPGILVGAVQDAFRAARFAPGEREGRPVPARIRIEVTFDSRRLDES